MVKKDSVYTEIEINATREQVWSVLTDFEKLIEWSTSFKNLEVEGEFKTDAKAISTYFGLLKGHDMTFDHHLIEVVDGFSFGWGDPLGIAGLSDHHIFKLEELSNGNTKFIQTDTLSGHSRLLKYLMTNNMDSQYKAFNKQLKKRVETLFPR
ncbi:MAG: SRPBCC family protein [Saprospiraceae bacterium]